MDIWQPICPLLCRKPCRNPGRKPLISPKRHERRPVQPMKTNTQILIELIEKTKADFRFKYVGGGYFRDKNVPMGKKADVRHGEEIIDEFCQELIKRLAD